jgi:phosphonate transport system substrate-binding protein
MAAQTGLQVRPVFIRTDDEKLAALKRGDVQAGWFSSTAALDAVRRANGEALAAAFPGGLSQDDQALLVVRRTNPITLDQLLKCGRRLSFGEGPRGSVAGVMAPTAQLFTPGGTTPELCFRTVHAGEMAENPGAVASGALDAAITDPADLDRYQGLEQPGAENPVRVIWASTVLPVDTIVLRKDLDPSVREKLRAFFVGYGHAPGAAGLDQSMTLHDLGYGGFREVDDAQLVLPFKEMEAAMRLRVARNAGDLKAQRQAEAELSRLHRAEAKSD